jgi:O-antigen/teichoic acid export membrane protein
MADTLTVDETTFPNAKSRNALIAYKAVADLAGKGSLLVITIVAARRLSPESFGVFAFGSTLGWIVAVVSDCGIQLHLARAVARAPAEASRLLQGWLRVRLWTTGAAVVIVAAGLAAGGRAASAMPIAILALTYACSGLIELLHYFYRGLSRSDVESSITLWQRGGTLGCGLVALAWKPDVTLLASAMLIPVVVTLAVSLRIAQGISAGTAYARLPPSGQGRFGEPRRSSRESSASEGGKPCATSGEVAPGVGATLDVFRRDVWPIGAGIVLSALYFRIDVFLVQLWSGTESVALYNAVFRLVEALRLFPAAVLAVALPSLVRAGDLRPLTRLALPITGFAIAAAAVLWIAAGWLIPFLYGAPYAPAVAAFRVLVLALPLLSLNFALTHQLVGWDGQRAYAWVCALALVTNVALNAQLIPLWSIEGAAWATLGTEIALTVGCGIALWSARAPAPTGRLVTEP